MHNNTKWALAALVGACVVGCNAGGGGSTTGTKPGGNAGAGTNPDGSPSGGSLNVDQPDLGMVDANGDGIIDAER
jgi:hypothetical protein